ncbi:MAG: hypothetical protein ACUVTD_08135 [Nitrososphaerales archaeon]
MARRKGDVIEVLRNDALIFSRLLTQFDKFSTSYEVAKKLFQSEIKGDYDLRKKESFIRHWFKRWNERGVIDCEVVNGIKTYSINPEKIKWGRARLTLRCGKFRERLELGFVIALKENSSWVVIPL